MVAELERGLSVEFGTPERTEWHLLNWSDWQRMGSTVNRLPVRASGGIGISGSSDFDGMMSESDVRCAQICEAIINDLPVPQSCAIHRRYLSAVWRFKRLNYAELLLEATLKIGSELAKRGVW